MEKPFAITLDPGSSRANHTGSWRVERPVYVDRMPPCNDACAAGENVQRWLYHAEDGSYEDAWRQIMEDNPMPAVMGRVCFHPCETSCNRGQLDEAVGINAVERFLGDQGIAEGWQVAAGADDLGARVLVVGSGPAGLSAAYHLRRLGHAVAVHEAAPMPGGMLRYGIPRYRLPRTVLDAEVARIASIGVEMHLGSRVADVAEAMRLGGFDAAFIAVGAQLSKNAYVPAGDAVKVLGALSVLGSMEGEGPPVLGRRVVVYGGGDTAMDVARSARRLGADDAVVVYRRTRDRMPAHASEVADAIEEGVRMRWLSTVAGEHEADRGALIIEKMELDEDGFPQPTGETEELEADALVLALGQEADLSFVAGVPGIAVRDGAVEVDAEMMTGCPGIFAGGDTAAPPAGSRVLSDRTVTVAAGHGKRAARAIDAWLRSRSGALPRTVGQSERHAMALFENLNTWYYADAPRSEQPRLDLARRQSSFDEVTGGLDVSNALFEARRCLSCGNCFECDNCFGVCPDDAVRKLGAGMRYAFDYDYCKGCGVCAAECPCGAIVMEPEVI